MTNGAAARGPFFLMEKNMGKFAGKKLLLLGERSGVSGEAMEKIFADSGAEIVYVDTSCLGCSLIEALDCRSQQRVRAAAEQWGAENLVAIIGCADTAGAKVYAETLTSGDPYESGSLAGIALHLPVFHALDDEIKADIAPELWKEHISMMERILDAPALASTVRAVREAKA